MPTLYVENVPADLYSALRDRAKRNRSSISAEGRALLAENVPPAKELARRKALLRGLVKLRSRRSPSPGPFLSAEEMLRQDRSR
jgi:plasmid stability protein